MRGNAIKSSEPFGEQHFMERFAEVEYGTLRSADFIPTRPAVSWTEGCNGEGNVCVRIKNSL